MINRKVFKIKQYNMSNDHNQNEELNEEEREKLRLENEILKLCEGV